ncbi:MAG TPA: SpoIIE family protein phosphatase [Nitrolancea sp.]|jgi:serine phosphatase RsbU (regulator of sigma subunit)|nr:SpoIIE family protein phosphatase [Nitrolancea sp.]
MDSNSLTIVGASRPHPNETSNGDGWVVHRLGDIYRLTVIDGLGHGPAAAAATGAALARLETAVTVDPAEVLRVCHDALSGTRGAVMLVACINPSVGQLRFAGVGNVEARLRQNGDENRLVSYRGIVGVILPTIRTFEFELSPDWLLVVHTDGIASRFDLAAELDGEIVSADWAQRFLERWARLTDDATVVAVTERLT